MSGDVDVLMGEYQPAAALVERLSGELAAATAERDAILDALWCSGLTQREVCELTGLTPTRLRTAVSNHWQASRAGAR